MLPISLLMFHLNINKDISEHQQGHQQRYLFLNSNFAIAHSISEIVWNGIYVHKTFFA